MLKEGKGKIREIVWFTNKEVYQVDSFLESLDSEFSTNTGIHDIVMHSITSKTLRDELTAKMNKMDPLKCPGCGFVATESRFMKAHKTHCKAFEQKMEDLK